MRDELTADERRVLEVLPGHPGWTVEVVAVRLGWDLFAARGVLEQLRERGLVARRVSWAGNTRNGSPLPARWSTITVEAQPLTEAA